MGCRGTGEANGHARPKGRGELRPKRATFVAKAVEPKIPFSNILACAHDRQTTDAYTRNSVASFTIVARTE